MRGQTLFVCLLLGLWACGPTSRNNGDDDSKADNDHDGYTPAGGDCNDMDPNIHPGALEICDDGIDNDCNGMTDSADYQCFTPCEKAAHDRSSVGCVYYS